MHRAVVIIPSSGTAESIPPGRVVLFWSVVTGGEEGQGTEGKLQQSTQRPSCFLTQPGQRQRVVVLLTELFTKVGQRVSEAVCPGAVMSQAFPHWIVQLPRQMLWAGVWCVRTDDAVFCRCVSMALDLARVRICQTFSSCKSDSARTIAVM